MKVIWDVSGKLMLGSKRPNSYDQYWVRISIVTRGGKKVYILPLSSKYFSIFLLLDMTIHLIYLFYYCRGAEAEAAVRWRQSCMSRAAGGVTRLVIAGTIWLHRPHLDITLGPASFQVSEI
jgi:hypothetical protein